MVRFFVCVLTCALACAADAAVSDSVTIQFSDVNNPTGVWSYRAGAGTLPRHAANTPVTNSFDPAASNGYWGANADYNTSVTKTTVNGSASTNGSQTFTNNDFLAGDVVVHSADPGSSTPLNVRWTAPSAGTITFFGSVWYAHSFVNRSNDYTVLLNGVPTGDSGTVDSTKNRSNPSTFLHATSLAVAAGDVLALQLTPHAGQTNGSLAGITFNVSLTPEPTSMTLLVSLGGAFMLARRRSQRP